MKIITVDNLKEGNVLAKDVLLPDYTVLLAKGTVIKQEYIDKLREYFIVTVYIEEKNEIEEPEGAEEKAKHELHVDMQELHLLGLDVENKVNSKVRDILELHLYQQDTGLEGLAAQAEGLIKDILKRPEVVEKIYEVKERGADIYEHCLTVCTMATLVAFKLSMDENRIYDIALSALIHDIGLRYLIARYENKDIHFLSAKEQEDYKKHGIYAYTSIKNESWISDATKDIILNHHERKNGAGYPLGKGEVSRECQILGVCDEFDEMICGIGKAKIRVHEAINCIRNYSGIWFDNDIVEAFLQLIAVYPVGTKVQTNHGEIAIVLKQNNHFPERPVLRVIEDKHGQTVKEDFTIDLVKDTRTVIDKVLM